jgi:glycosyltransferase involved in cell wall biosynthesis
MKVIYLFGGTRVGQIENVRNGIQPDDHFHGMLRMRLCSIDADYLELEKVYPHWLSVLFRKFLSVYFVHIPIFYKLFYCDVIFASTAYGTEFIFSLLHVKKPKWIINDFGLIGRIGKAQTIKQKIFKWMVGQAGGIVTLGNKEAEELKQIFPNLRDKICFIPFGVDTKFFRPIDVIEKNQILSPGFDPGRDYQLLFSAIENIDVKLVLSKSRNIDQIAELPNNVQTMFLSWKNLVLEYARSKIVVIPLDLGDGKNDAMGTSSLVQAMAMGKAVIVTRTSTTESYIEDGVNGILVEPHDCSAMRIAIIDLLKNENKRMLLGANARKFVEKNCDADHSAMKMSEFFRSLI